MYRSVLIRMWRDEEKEVTDWQAEVQQIQSGESWAFSSQETLLKFLHQLIEEFESENRNGRDS